MSGTTLLVTERFEPTARLASALLRAGAHKDPSTVVAASFTPGRAPAASILGRLGMVHRSLSTGGAPSADAALVGACEAISARRVIVWNCPRAVSALHALRLLRATPVVDYILPIEGSAAWDETGITVGRAANLIDTFVVEDGLSASRLLAAGVDADGIVRSGEPRRNDDSNKPRHGPDLVIGASRDDGTGGTPCTAAALVAAALGWCPQAGTMEIADPTTDGTAALWSARAHGWDLRATVPEVNRALEAPA